MNERDNIRKHVLDTSHITTSIEIQINQDINAELFQILFTDKHLLFTSRLYKGGTLNEGRRYYDGIVL